MSLSSPHDLIHRAEQLLAEGRLLRAAHRRVHFERVRLFEWAERLHFTEPMLSDRPLPESPKLPEGK